MYVDIKIKICEYKLNFTATSATNTAQRLDTPGFSAVAVTKNTATGTATTATKNSNIKGDETK